MAILVERRLGRCPIAAEHTGPRDRRKADGRGARGDVIELAIVNNMPDTALEATERQFLGLLQFAAMGRPVRIRLFSFPGVARSELGRRRLEARYADIGDLWNSRVDALIVTGAEPRAPSLRDKPYWPTLAKLVDWARSHTVASIWSCLAAHAAVLALDGIERQPLARKWSGVFECSAVSGHPLLRRSPAVRLVPHSRGNGLPEDGLAAAGYELLTRSREVGVDAFLAERESLFLFLQGHPEYEADTLLREYRRDVGRFLRGERPTYPDMPANYFDPATATAFEAFRARVMGEREEALMAEFPAPQLAPALSRIWQMPAARIYRNWLAFVAARRRHECRPVPVAKGAGRGRALRGPPASRRLAAGL